MDLFSMNPKQFNTLETEQVKKILYIYTAVGGTIQLIKAYHSNFSAEQEVSIYK